MRGYELLELLSSGHACDTYDAWSEERGCRVIVRTGDVRREGRLLQRLTHPNIVRAYEVHRDWIVLETLSGVHARPPCRALDRDDAIEMGRQLCSAVGYLHRQGWLHLDLKPDNLIADGGRLKVIDFSIAQRPGPLESGTGTRALDGARAGARRRRDRDDRRLGHRRRAALRPASSSRSPTTLAERPSVAGRDSMARWSPEPASGASATGPA